MALITNQTQIKDVQIGDTFNRTANKYGQYKNCVITNVIISKKGKICVFYETILMDFDGILYNLQNLTWGQLSLSPDTLFYNY